MSLGGATACTNSQTMQSAIDDVKAQGATVVVAAGNSNIDTAGYTPAGCNNVISVAANDSSNQRASFSNYGDKVDVISPGVNILSLSHTGGSRTLSGTSMTAPHVADVVSLMIAKNPNLSPALLEQILKDSITDFNTNSNCHKDHGNYNNKRYGTGRVNTAKTLLALPNQGIQGPTGPQELAGAIGPQGLQREKGEPGGDTSFFTQVGASVALQGQNYFEVGSGHITNRSN